MYACALLREDLVLMLESLRASERESVIGGRERREKLSVRLQRCVLGVYKRERDSKVSFERRCF